MVGRGHTLNRKCCRCGKEWETEAIGGYFSANHDPICNECWNKEIDEHHSRHINDLNRDIFETEFYDKVVKLLAEHIEKLDARITRLEKRNE